MKSVNMADPNDATSFARRHPKDLEIIERLRSKVHASRVIDAIGQWRGPGQWAERDVNQIHGLVVHQSVGSGSVHALARYHTGKNHITGDNAEGLPSPAYWAFIDRPTGAQLERGELPAIWILNSLSDRTWSHGYGGMPGDENALFLGICVGGSFKPAGPDDPLPEQTNLLIACWETLAELYSWTPATWLVHADLGKKSCPGDALSAVVQSYRAPYRVLAERNLPLLQRTETGNQLWQAALQDLGFYRGEVDGLWGRKSIEALQQWRRVKRLTSVKRDPSVVLSRYEFDQWLLFAEIRKFRQEAAS